MIIALVFCYISRQVKISANATVTPEAGVQCVNAEIYQCNNCLTRYDKLYGDSVNGVAKDVDFKKLDNYEYPVCEAPKSEFSLVVLNN